MSTTATGFIKAVQYLGLTLSSVFSFRRNLENQSSPSHPAHLPCNHLVAFCTKALPLPRFMSLGNLAFPNLSFLICKMDTTIVHAL